MSPRTEESEVSDLPFKAATRRFPQTVRGQYLVNLINECERPSSHSEGPVDIQMRIVRLLCALLEEKIV